MPLHQHHGVTPQLDPTAFLADGAMLVGDVRVGADASIWFNAVLRGDINAITIGPRSNIQDGVVGHVTRRLPLSIGPEVTVGHMAMLHGCTLHDRVLVGMNAVILDAARPTYKPEATTRRTGATRSGFRYRIRRKPTGTAARSPLPTAGASSAFERRGRIRAGSG